MSNFDKQARQVSRYDLVSGYMQKWPDGEFVYHSDYQALLDELEAKDKAWAAQDDHINQQADWIESLEKKNGDLGKALGAAEERNARAHDLLSAATAENVWEIIGRLKVVISGDYRSESEIAAAAGKGD
jgi:hypothetical protein